MARTAAKGNSGVRVHRSAKLSQPRGAEIRVRSVEPIELLEEARKRLQTVGRTMEKRATQLRREIASQGQRLAHDVRTLARRRVRLIGGQLETRLRPARHRAEQLASVVTRRMEALQKRLEDQLRHLLTTRLGLATQADLARLRRRIDTMETRLNRSERSEGASAPTKPSAEAPSAAA